MKFMKKILLKSASAMDLPANLVAGMPLIELIGNTECSIEPHKGLLEYTKEEISIQTSVGPIAIQGKNLSLKLMNNSRVTIVGTVEAMALQGE